jgi:hypothetical protein
MGWVFIQQPLPRESEDGTVWGSLWMLLPHTAQLDWAMREGYLWSRHCWWGGSNGSPHTRQPKGRKVTPRELCKQEVSTLRGWSWRSCLSKGFTYEGREEVWSEGKISTSLHWTIPYYWEVWNHGIQAWIATIIDRSSWHLPRITTEKVLEGTRGRYIARSDTARIGFDQSWSPDQDLGSEGLCH